MRKNERSFKSNIMRYNLEKYSLQKDKKFYQSNRWDNKIKIKLWNNNLKIAKTKTCNLNVTSNNFKTNFKTRRCTICYFIPRSLNNIYHNHEVQTQELHANFNVIILLIFYSEGFIRSKIVTLAESENQNGESDGLNPVGIKCGNLTRE